MAPPGLASALRMGCSEVSEPLPAHAGFAIPAASAIPRVVVTSPIRPILSSCFGAFNM